MSFRSTLILEANPPRRFWNLAVASASPGFLSGWHLSPDTLKSFPKTQKPKLLAIWPLCSTPNVTQ